MHVIVIGGGNVGQHVAKELLEKEQTVVLIDRDQKTIEAIRTKLDMNLIHGNGASIEVLEKAKIASADMLIALMENDDANILACMLAKTFSKDITTIARVRDPKNAGSIDIDTYGLTKKQVGLDVIVSPEQAVAEEMMKSILFPDVDAVDYFANERVLSVGKRIGETSRIRGMKVSDIDLGGKGRIVGITKENGNFLFPSDADTLHEGDTVYLLGTLNAIRNISRLFAEEHSKIERILILGGGITGAALAAELESIKQRSFVIKLIEADPRRCEELTGTLKRTLVIQGQGTDDCYYNEEEICEADVLVTATGDDRVNLIASVIAKEGGVHRILNALASTEYRAVYPKMGLDKVINPQWITAEKIIRYIHRERVVSLALVEEDVEVFEVVLESGCQAAGKRIAQIDFPKSILIGAIVRDGIVIIPDANTTLEKYDHLIIVAREKSSLRIAEYFVSPSAG